MWLEMLGIGLVPLPVGERDALPDPDAAARLIGPRTRAIVLISPNNPTGATYPAERIDAFYALAQRHGIALVLDETYKDFRAEAAPAHALFRRQTCQVLAPQLHPTTVGRDGPGDGSQGRRLARPVATEHRQHLPGLEVEVDAPNGRDLAVADREVADVEHQDPVPR